MAQIDGTENGLQGGSLNSGINMGNIGGNLNIPDLTPIGNISANLQFGDITIDETPTDTGETTVIEETITYSEEERKENAMSMAELTYQLSELKQEYSELITSTNAAIREKRDEIDALEAEIKSMQEGIVNGEETVETECQIFETPTQNILVKKGELLSSENIKNVIAKTAAQIADYNLRHPEYNTAVIDDPVVQTEVQSVDNTASPDVVEQTNESM